MKPHDFSIFLKTLVEDICWHVYYPSGRICLVKIRKEQHHKYNGLWKITKIYLRRTHTHKRRNKCSVTDVVTVSKKKKQNSTIYSAIARVNHNKLCFAEAVRKIRRFCEVSRAAIKRSSNFKEFKMLERQVRIIGQLTGKQFPFHEAVFLYLHSLTLKLVTLGLRCEDHQLYKTTVYKEAATNG